MKKINLMLLLIIASAMIVGCDKDDNNNNPIPNGDGPPTITATSPTDNQTNVARNTKISVTFSEAMDSTTINGANFILVRGTTSIVGTITYSGNTAVFSPNASLNANTEYTVTVNNSVKDVGGTAMATARTWKFTTSGSSSPIAVINLGSAIDYIVLAKTAISNVPTSNITGDLGLSPAATSFVTGFALTNNTGFATSSQVTGNIYAADMASPTSNNLTNAVNDMESAYDEAAGRSNPDFLELGTGNLGGLSLSPGLYKWTSNITAPTNVVISGGANDVWIFQTSGNMSVATNVNFTLAGGAEAKNIFWQIAGELTLGANANIKGVVLSKTGITLGTGATMQGRALAQTAVILDSNVLTEPQ